MILRNPSLYCATPIYIAQPLFQFQENQRLMFFNFEWHKILLRTIVQFGRYSNIWDIGCSFKNFKESSCGFCNATAISMLKNVMFVYFLFECLAHTRDPYHRSSQKNTKVQKCLGTTHHRPGVGWCTLKQSTNSIYYIHTLCFCELQISMLHHEGCTSLALQSHGFNAVQVIFAIVSNK